MPTQTLTASTITLDDGAWSIVGGTDGSVLNTDDGDTSCATCTPTAGYERYALSDIPATAAGISDVSFTTWKARATNIAARPTRLALYLAGNYSFGTTQTVPVGAYVSYSDLALGKPGGGTWTATDINAMELTIQTTTDVGDGEVRITYVKTDVSFYYSGGFVFMPVFRRFALLAGLILSDMPKIADTIYHETGILIRPDEYAQALRESKEYRAPKYYFFIGGTSAEPREFRIS